MKPDFLIFSERRAIAQEFLKWANENDAAPSAENMVTFLSGYGALNTETARKIAREGFASMENDEAGKGSEPLELFWPETGKLEILVRNNLSSTLRFMPSAQVIAETAAEIEKRSRKGLCEKIREDGKNT